jgi:hypothetical protein
MLIVLLIILILGYAGNGFKGLSLPVTDFLFLISRYYQWILTFVIVVPLAITMALLWKTKEVILSVFLLRRARTKTNRQVIPQCYI